MTIPAFDRVEKMVTETHSAFPYCGIVGWDIALDKLDRAVLIEANIWVARNPYRTDMHRPYVWQPH